MGALAYNLIVKTHATNVESHGLSPTIVWALFIFPVFNLKALNLTTPYKMKEVLHDISFGEDV